MTRDPRPDLRETQAATEGAVGRRTSAVEPVSPAPEPLSARFAAALGAAVGVLAGVGIAAGMLWAGTDRARAVAPTDVGVDRIADVALAEFPEADPLGLRVSFENRAEDGLTPVEIRIFLPADRFSAEILPRGDRMSAGLFGAIDAETLRSRLDRISAAARPYDRRSCAGHRVGPRIPAERAGLSAGEPVRALRIAFDRPCRGRP